jgi:co-chaperonin GroES (HSP10)
MTSSSIIALPIAETLEQAFPKADPGANPYGNRVLVQLRSPKRTTASGIVLPEEARDYERWMTTIGKVIKCGPLAFKDRDTLKDWPEGMWAKEGDFVRCPKWGGDRWEIMLGHDVSARFCIYRDHEIIAGIYGDPMSFKDYV